MRFDAARVIEMAEWLGTLEAEDGRREDVAADLVAEAFQNLGWRVDRPDEAVVASRPSSAPTRVVIKSPFGRARVAPWQGWIHRSFGRLRGRGLAASDSIEVGVRTGLAFLLELARTWPASRSSRVDVAFSAVRTVRVRQAAEREPRPTLFLDVLAPGLGQGVVIGGSCRDLAIAAARGLWIPHREKRFGTLPSQSAVIVGDGSLGDEAATVDPAALDRTAQLVTELAFRWAKERVGNGPAPQADDDRRASRSSQNPG
ncbi:hypothetical protein [Aquisphaera giovannonii]|nr:hypothetical protein [Aquisphaera giovannonii]